MRTIRITLDKNGNTHLEVLGDHGEHCLELTSDLERRLGTLEGERQYKKEFDEEPEPEPGETDVER